MYLYHTAGLVLFTLTISISCGKGLDDPQVSLKDGDRIIPWKSEEKFDAYIRQAMNIGTSGKTLLSLILPELLKLGTNTSLSSRCVSGLVSFVQGLTTYQLWALEMADASAKIESGILKGKFSFIGSYDECLNVHIPDEIALSSKAVLSDVKGQYCSVVLQPVSPQMNITLGENETLKSDKLVSFQEIKKGGDVFASMAIEEGLSAMIMYRIGVCIPNSCSIHDLNALLKSATTLVPTIQATAVKCEVNETPKLTGAQIGITVMFSFLLLFLVLGSLLDILMNHQRGTVDNNNNVYPVLNSKIFKVLLCFSVYTNGKKILNTKTASDNMGALHGIRFLSMTWVLLGHTYGFLNFQAIENVADAAEITTNFAFLAVSNATVSVDTFFFLSGFLVAYVTLKTMKKKDGHLSLPLYYFHRFWRLTPPYAFVIAFTVVWRIMSRGPFWDEMVIVQAENCRKNWWATLLYVSNFVNSEEICLGHGWYLSNDMQFYVLTPLIIIPLYKWPVAGLVINFLFLLTATITPGVLNSMNNFPPNGVIGQDVKRMMEQFRMIYVKPYCRMGPYCVGIFAAYLLLKHRNMKIKPVFQVIGWCLAIACNLSVIYGIYPWNKGNLPSNEVAALYTATHRTAWSLGIAWLTVACVTGHGGPVNALLSWKAFIPLGRLSYLSYLSHPLVMYYNFGRHRGNFYFSHYNTVYLFLSYLVLSLAVAFIASVAVEGPFMALEKVILPGERKTKTEKTAPTENGKDSNGNVAVMITNEEKPGVDNPTFTKDNHNTYM